MSSQPVSFFVAGTPHPQGSLTRMPNGALLWGKTQDAHDQVLDWRRRVATAAQIHGRPCKGGVRAEYLFVLPRPPSVTRAEPSVKPDCDKLARAVGDALQLAGIIEDDSRIVQLLVTKVYADPAADDMEPKRITLWHAIYRFVKACGGHPEINTADDERLAAAIAIKRAAFALGGAVAPAASRARRTPGVHISIEEIQ